jgi:membrane protein
MLSIQPFSAIISSLKFLSVKFLNTKIILAIKQVIYFYHYVLQRFFNQDCTEKAAALTYTSLLSLVPLMTVVFAAFSSFSIFNDAFVQSQNFIFSNFIPSSSEVIQNYLEQFTTKASKLTFVGLVSLFVVALMLMWQIDRALNKIWGIRKGKNFLRTFLTYWATLTLGPLLIGISLIVTSYITSLPLLNEAAQSIGHKNEILSFIPSILSLLAFTLIYLIIPNTRVLIHHAIIGGITATFLFELAKRGFALYISQNTTYSNLYGALATLPIFLIWIYISWLVTLLGAMTTRSMSLFDFSLDREHGESSQFSSSFHVLRMLSGAAKKGCGLTEKNIHKDKILRHEKMLDSILIELERLNWIHKTENELWALSKDLEDVSLWNLYENLPYSLPKKLSDDHLSHIISQNNELLAKEMDMSLKSIFSHYHPG